MSAFRGAMVTHSLFPCRSLPKTTKFGMAELSRASGDNPESRKVQIPQTADPTGFGMKGNDGLERAQISLETLWTKKMKFNFNTMVLGKPFRYSRTCLIIGGEDGIIRVYKISDSLGAHSLQEILTVETKSGPVSHMFLQDVTKFGSTDLIIGDSKGTVTIIGNEQILNRRSLSEGCISSLTIDRDLAGNLAIVVGDSEGNIIAVSPHSSLWKLRLQDIMKHPTEELSVSPAVKSMLSVKLQTSVGIITNYVLIADSSRNLYFLQNGTVVKRMQVPSVVMAMTAGYFLTCGAQSQVRSPVQALSSPRWQSGTVPRLSQVALGMESGAILVLNDFQLLPFVNVQLPVTQLECLKPHDESVDFLLCIGHFDALMVFQEQELILQHRTRDWVRTMACREIGPSKEVLLGLADNTVESYKVMLSS